MESEGSISCSQQAGCFSSKQKRWASLVSEIFSCYRILQLLCFKKSTARWNWEDTSVRYGGSWNRRCSSGNLHLQGAFDCVIQEWQFVALNCAVAKIVSLCRLSNDRMTVNIVMERNGKLTRVTSFEVLHTHLRGGGFRHNSRHPGRDSKRASLESKNKISPTETTCSAVRIAPR